MRERNKNKKQVNIKEVVVKIIRKGRNHKNLWNLKIIMLILIKVIMIHLAILVMIISKKD